MTTFWNFILKEGKHILRDRRTILLLFGMPIVMMLLLGFAIRTDVKDVRTVVVLSSIDHATQRTIAQLDASEYFSIVTTTQTPQEAEQIIRAKRAEIAFVFPTDFASLRGKAASVQLLTDAADPNMAQQYANYALSILSTSQLTNAHTGLAYSSLLATQQLYNPQMLSAYNFVPGIMGIVLMLICAMMTSISIVKEKEYGTMEVLLVSPVKPIYIIIAKAIPYFALAIVILMTILLTSFYVLDVPLAGSLFGIIIISLIYILMSLGIGLLISNLAQSQLVALLVSALVLLMPSMMLSGMLFPVESMPKILQLVAHINPTTHYISAMKKLMIMGLDIAHVATELWVLVGYTLSFLGVAMFTFKQRLS